MAPSLSAATGWLLYAGIFLTLGGLAAHVVLLPRIPQAPEPVRDWLSSAAGQLGLAGASILPIALGLVFLRQLLEFRDPFVPWTEDAELLLGGTPWGRTWLWGAAGSVLAAGAFAFAVRGSTSGWWVGGAAVLGLGTFPAFTGHAAGTEALRALTITADTVHVVAGGAWAGGLTFVLYASAGWKRRTDPPADSLLPLLVPVFSPLAIACVTALVLTGVLAAWVHLPEPGALLGSPYGRLLSLKLALAVAVLALGLLNWKRLTPRLGQPGGPRALRRAATMELFAVQAVLLVTAILVRTPPPMH